MSKPRKAKSETATTAPAANTTTAVKPIPEAKALAAAAGAATTAATIALCVLVILPPKEKFEAGAGYWQIQIADNKGQLYSNIYRCKSLDKAKSLATTIATERHIPIITKEPPAPRAAVEQPVPADVPADHFQAPNFTDVGDLSDLEPDPMPF